MRAETYLFGDGDVAARRLELLGHVFADSTRAFLAGAAVRRPQVAIDLGCGPGFTTHLIAETLGCARAVGLDASARFIELARATANHRVTFELHDVCAVPFPGAPADLIFCRFLLTHLKNPAQLVATWAGQLKPGGILMVEEVEAIRTSHPIFARYLAVLEAMLSSRSNSLYAGAIVAGLESAGGPQVISSEVRRLAVRNTDAAQMFVMNMQAWKDDDFIRSNYARETVAELEAGLNAIARDGLPRSEIEWSLRETIFQ